MSKTWIAVSVGVLVIAGGYYFVKLENKPKYDVEVTDSPSGKKMAFSEFAKQGGTYQCDIKQFTSDFENSGKVYGDGENQRMDIVTVAEGQNFEMHVIRKGEYAYYWSSDMPGVGQKMKIPKGENPTGETFLLSADKVGDYNCESWTTDNSKFELPSAVTFTEIKAQ